MKAKKSDFHPVSNLFPLMQGAEFEALVEDIRQNGQRELICIHPQDDRIIDGRNRYRACIDACVETKYYEWDGKGSLVEYVVSLNLARRHLTPSQRAVLAVDMLPMLEKEAKERQRLGKSTLTDPEEAGQARDKSAASFNVANSYVSDAKNIKKQRRSLFEAVRSGEKTLSEAKAEIRREKVAEERAATAVATTKGKRVKKLEDVAGSYETVYLDPPWAYADPTCQGAAANEYDTAGVEYLKTLPIAELLVDQAHLWMWITWPKIRDGHAHRLLKAWDLSWKGEIVWDKDKMGMGRWLRVQTEVLVLGVKGKSPRRCDDLRGLYREASKDHSEKPEAFYEMIERFSPGPRIELFARVAHEGWDRWGKEAP